MERESYKKNDIVRLTIEDIGNDGEGIGKADGYTLFVKDAVIGDVIEARITKCKKNYGYARVEKVVTPSPFRVEPKCPFHRQCGGCQIQAMSYERQLVYKQNKVRNHLRRIGGFPPELLDKVMEPIVGMEEPWHYRNKAQYPVGYDKAGNLVVGFYAGRTHDIIANTDCPLGPPENKEILEAVLTYMRENGVSAYRESTGEGLVRHVLIRTGFASGEIMVCLVINGKRLPTEEKLVETLTGLELEDEADSTDGCGRSAAGDEEDAAGRGQTVQMEKWKAPRKRIVSISVSINREKTNVIMGQEIRVLWGRGWIEDSLRVMEAEASVEGGSAEHRTAGDGDAESVEKVSFQISPLSFYQVNPRQTEKLYGLALEYAGLTGKETVWDLYCGIGTISLFLAKRAKMVYGVEIVPQAIEDARENARRNGITNAEFFVGKAEEVLPGFYKRKSSVMSGENTAGNCLNGLSENVNNGAAGKTNGIEWAENDRMDTELQMRHPDVIVVDPRRKGCDEKCLETMIAMRPGRIVYVSCDPATLARDLKVLCGGGYELKRVRGVDQFGGTGHVEAVVMLSHKKPDSVINVKVEFGEGEGKVPLDNIAKRAEAYKPKERVTYKMIKEYIEAKYGFKVHTAYIAEVKRELGLPMYDAPNAVEELKQPRKHPTAEKVEAIKDALKHFKIS